MVLVVALLSDMGEEYFQFLSKTDFVIRPNSRTCNRLAGKMLVIYNSLLRIIAHGHFLVTSFIQ